MSSSGAARGGGAAFTQGTFAARPAAAVGIPPYFATDTGEWWIPNAAGNAWQSLMLTSAGQWNVGSPGIGGWQIKRVDDNNLQILDRFNDVALTIQNPFLPGKVTANQDLDVSRIGQGLRVAEGANAKQGTAVLVAGTVTVANTSVTASSRIAHWRQVLGGTVGHLSIGTITAGTSFVINSSSGTDTSTVGYEIFEPG